MILTAHQPTYLPWLGLFSKIAQADVFCILDTVQYERKSFENRNTIKTQNGPLMLSVPVESSGHFAKTGGNIRIVQNGWARKHVRAIELAYAKAPYFNTYFQPLKETILFPHETLFSLNHALLDYLLAMLNIETRMVIARNYSFQGEKSYLVLDMCNQLGATKYIFGAQGVDYADRQAFANAGIAIEFQNFQCKPYQQLHGDFVPNLSAIDALFNLGTKARDLL